MKPSKEFLSLGRQGRPDSAISRLRGKISLQSTDAAAFYCVLWYASINTKRISAEKLETLVFCGASGRSRTGTPLRARDFKSLVSTSSTTEAQNVRKIIVAAKPPC
jgi:hypothetical protein